MNLFLIKQNQKNNYKVCRILLLPKELIGFVNGIIASYLAAVLMDTEFSSNAKIFITICGVLIIIISIALIKYRDNYDDNRKIKSKSDAWKSINNNLSENKIIWLLPKHGIPIIHFIIVIAFIISGCFFTVENNHIKHEKKNTIEKIAETDSLVHSIGSMFRQQINHANRLEIDIRRIECKMDSLIIMNNQLIKNRNKPQKIEGAKQ